MKNRLTGIVIPDGVTEIETSTFSGCTSLTNVNLPDSLADQAGHFADTTTNYVKLRDLGQLLNFNVGFESGKGVFVETDKPYTDVD